MSGSGTVKIPVGSVLWVGDGGAKKLESGRVLEIGGMAQWESVENLELNRSQLRVVDGGEFDMRSEADIYWNGSNIPSPLIDNAGLFRKTGGGMTVLGSGGGISFNNSGEVKVEDGTLQLNGGGGSSAGEFYVGAGGLLTFESNYTLSEGASVTGTGPMRWSG